VYVLLNSLLCYKSDCTRPCVFPNSLPNYKYHTYLDSNPRIELCSPSKKQKSRTEKQVSIYSCQI